jgi:SAM-dependent methyltransferase
MPYKRIIEDRVDSYLPIDIENSSLYAGHDVVYWDGVNIPLDDNSVDCLLASELLEHVDRPMDISREIFRVLKPGGLWIGTVPFLWPMHEVPFDRARYTPYTLSDIIQTNGFKLEEMSALGGIDCALAQLLGVWFFSKRRSTNRKLFKIKRKLLLLAMRRLYSQDKQCDVYEDGAMFTGLGWVAKKP